jgi:hypothetical protein
LDELRVVFFYEFIDNSDFPENKKQLLEKDLGHYYIPNDFTIYQPNANHDDKISIDDYHNNYATVMIMLTNMPTYKATDFIKFHYDKYQGDKINFLNNVISEFTGAKFSQGKNTIPAPTGFQIVLDWCKEKLIELENKHTPKKKSNKTFVNVLRISELSKIKSVDFDLTKLMKLLEEINDNYAIDNFLSVAILGRAILDHIPPIFNYKTFNEVANNYGGVSFKKNMGHLNNSMRSIADTYLHSLITKKSHYQMKIKLISVENLTFY